MDMEDGSRTGMGDGGWRMDMRREVGRCDVSERFPFTTPEM